ncbi:hypothetical protein KKG41_03175 [Patescibacteria group bacterium]|nr:hypothetical protein [Patescibacteria group bacterium]
MEVVQILTTPVYDSFVNQSHKSLLKIALLISNKPTLKKTLVKRGVKQISKLLSEYRVIKNEIDSFENNYHWIHNNYYNVQRLGVDYVLGEIRHMLVRKENIKAALKKENNVQKANKLMKVKLIKEYGLTKELVNLIRLSEKVTRWQDDRKAVVYQINPIMFRVFREVGGRFSLPWQKVAMGTDKEIVALLKTGKYPKEEWKKRRHRATVIHTKKGYKILTGKKAELLMIKDLSMKLDDRKLLKGIIACPGIAKGVVRITNNTKSIKLIKKGEVLVANNTTPDYVPAMKKAAAVVTEQGGITGHASIVSRELNIPCIVGVEGITKVLKNGQKVEVNAIRGIINIL